MSVARRGSRAKQPYAPNRLPPSWHVLRAGKTARQRSKHVTRAWFLLDRFARAARADADAIESSGGLDNESAAAAP